jgi:hypothetical protein
MGFVQKAIVQFDRVLELDPTNFEAIYRKLICASELGSWEHAFVIASHAVEINPESAELWNERGRSLSGLKRYEEAVENYDTALSLKTRLAEAWTNRGNSLTHLARDLDAVFSYDRALEVKPDCANTLYNKSLALLRIGDFERGFQLYESRRKQTDQIVPAREFKQPLWLGQQSLSGKTIFVHCEQGLGDTIMFLRYVREVLRLASVVIFEVQLPLYNLLKSQPEAFQIIRQGDVLPEFDYYVPLLSLPLALKTQLCSIPAKIPYIDVPQRHKKKWQIMLGPRSKPRIGIAWSSSSKFKEDTARSMSLEDFSKTFQPNQFELIVLQNFLKEQDESVAQRRKDIRFFTKDIKDFSDTAAIATQLDLVISTCTSVPHLTAAMGIPTWILLSYTPDWRWMLNRSDSPWYPTVKLFRQQREGDWDSVIYKVKQEIKRIFNQS